MTETRLRRRQAAAILTEAGYPITMATLASMAARGSGPPYQLWGRVALYDRDALLAWAANRAEIRAGNEAVRGVA